MKLCALAIALACVSSACTDPPGTLVGAYGITMHLESNSCGASGLPLADGYRYTVELRADEHQGYWRVPKAPPLDGTYDAGTGAFAFGTTEVLTLPNPDGGLSTCTLLRDEELTGVVALGDAGVVEDGGSATDGAVIAAPLEGSHNITFTTNPAGSCAGNPGPLGPFVVLPCAAIYEITGTAHKKF